MIVSEKLDESSPNHPLTPSSAEEGRSGKQTREDAPKLPGVLFLLRDAALMTWNLRMVVYGYTAWLLIPIILFLFAQGVPSPYGNYLLAIENALAMVLGLWVTAAIILYVAIVMTKADQEDIDYTALGKRAWEKVLSLFIIQVFTVCLVIFGSILFIVPGIIAWVWTAFAMQENILSDSDSVMENFKRSRALARGKFMAILGRMLIANLIFAIIILMIFAVFILVGLHGSASLLVPTLQAWPNWLEVGLSLVALPLAPVAIIFHLLLYFAVKKSYSAANV